MSWREFAWRGAALAVALLAALGLRRATAFELISPTAGASLVRLSWTARPERVERCRRLTDDELAQLPAHMRLRVECEGTFARYHLTVRIDGALVASDTIRGSGLRHDRPMHVFSEIAVTPGSRRLVVALARIDSLPTDSAAAGALAGQEADTLLGAREGREMDERRRRTAEAIPSLLRLDTTLTLATGAVVLVTWDPGSRQLIGKLNP